MSNVLSLAAEHSGSHFYWTHIIKSSNFTALLIWHFCCGLFLGRI